jgi:MFS family permease
MNTLLQPSDQLKPADVARGLRLLLFDGAFGQILLVLTTGGFLIGFALELGAPNTIIGLIAAVGPLAQILQIPAIFLVEQFRRRKLMTLCTALVGRLAWVGIAVIPWALAPRYRIPALLVFLILHYGLGNVAGCAYNSWLRDLVPVEAFGSFFARRLAVATFAGAVLSVTAAFGIDAYRDRFGQPFGAYAALYLVAAVSGMLSLVYLARVPEPAMPAAREGSVWAMLGLPFRDGNFRRLLVFLGLWNFAVNFAAPFFAVYLLKDLRMTMAWVIGLTVLSQFINVLFFRLWGRLADRFTNKSVLSVSGPLFIFSFLIWPFTTMPDKYVLTIPLLITIHVLAGISTAGVTLCAGNLALRLAPYGKATAYLAVNALISGVAATIAPIVAGFAADYFAPYELKVSLTWLYWEESRVALDLPTVDLRGLDFVFLMAFVFGVIALQRLIRVKEEGEVDEGVVRNALFAEMRRFAQQVSTVAGARQLTVFPYGTLKQWRKRQRESDRWLP